MLGRSSARSCQSPCEADQFGPLNARFRPLAALRFGRSAEFTPKLQEQSSGFANAQRKNGSGRGPFSGVLSASRCRHP